MVTSYSTNIAHTHTRSHYSSHCWLYTPINFLHVQLVFVADTRRWSSGRLLLQQRNYLSTGKFGPGQVYTWYIYNDTWIKIWQRKTNNSLRIFFLHKLWISSHNFQCCIVTEKLSGCDFKQWQPSYRLPQRQKERLKFHTH